MVLSVLSVSVRGHTKNQHTTKNTSLGLFGINTRILSVLSVPSITSFSTSLPFFWMCVGTDTAKTDETPAPPLQPPVVLGGLS
jgi:hypothetical protein